MMIDDYDFLQWFHNEFPLKNATDIEREIYKDIAWTAWQAGIAWTIWQTGVARALSHEH